MITPERSHAHNLVDLNVKTHRAGNVYTIDKDSITYSTVYGRHDKPLNLKNFPEDISAMVLETGTVDWSGLREDARFQIDSIQYRPLYSVLRKKQIPAVFADPLIRESAVVADMGVLSAEAIAGIFALFNLGEKTYSGKVSRRDFIKGIAGGYLALPFLTGNISYMASTTDSSFGIVSSLQKSTHAIHPEIKLIIQTLRNVVIAEKMEWLAHHYYGKHSHVAAALGGGHVLIENDLIKSSDERLAILSRFRPFLNMFLKEPETFHKIVITEKEDFTKIADVIDVPDLKKLTQGRIVVKDTIPFGLFNKVQ